MKKLVKSFGGLLLLAMGALALLPAAGGEAALAAEKSAEIALPSGSYTYSYTLELDPIDKAYSSAQFEITLENNSGLSVTDIAFDEGILRKSSGTVSTLEAGGEASGSRTIYRAGFLSTDNNYRSETKICTVTFSYTGNEPMTVAFGNLQIWRYDGESNGIPKLIKETPVWSRTITFSRLSGVSSGGAGAGSASGEKVTVSGSSEKTTVRAVLKGGSDGKGAIKAYLSDEIASSLISSLKSAEAAGKKAVAELKLESEDETLSAEVQISGSAYAKLAAETDTELAVETGIGSISFDPKAVLGIGALANGGDISLRIAKVEASSLNEEQSLAVGDRQVYDFSIFAGGKRISELGGGRARINVPYAPKEGEDKNAIVAFFLDEKGAPQLMRGAYDEKTGMVEFVVKHLSLYYVGYRKIVFEDASGGWYSDAVTFIAARGITSGTGSGRFEPDKAVTRAQFLVMLMRAYCIEPDEEPKDSFSDAGNTYYTGYLSAAKRMGIAKGVGGNRFAPEREITRQDMFTLLYRSLAALDELPEPVREADVSDFLDAADVSDYAMAPLNALVKGGIASGSGGRLEPLAASTRAQMAQVLYSLLRS